ncbi:hypothetical protein JOM56_000692 [Amanita muscaria]
MTCYEGGKAVFNNHECVMFKCYKTKYYICSPRLPLAAVAALASALSNIRRSKSMSFYCHCIQGSARITTYSCEKIKCACVPRRFNSVSGFQSV